jgi:hypothetical protein
LLGPCRRGLFTGLAGFRKYTGWKGRPWLPGPPFPENREFVVDKGGFKAIKLIYKRFEKDINISKELESCAR